MKKVLIINGHQYYDVVARGELTNKIIEKATKFFENNGFELIPNNDKHLEFVLNLLGEDKGNYILVNSITNDFIDWDLLHKCYNDKIEYYIPEERKNYCRDYNSCTEHR